MKKRIYKACMALILAIVLTAYPVVDTCLAPALNWEQVVNAYADTDASAETNNNISYNEVKAYADKKAAVLTNFYNETSLQYALIDNGKIVLSGQSGISEKGNQASLTSDSMYGIGSISKMFTATAVMQLVDQGKVNLDDPVIKYLPEFTMEDSRYKDITVRMLLNHSSGLMGSTMSSSMLLGDNTIGSYDNFLNSLKTQRLKADPGEYSVYCNDGFTLAQLLVEKVSQMTFTDYIKENISGPLNLNNTKTPRDSFDRNRLAKTFLSDMGHALPSETVTMIGAGGIYSSAENLCRFAETFMNDRASGILSAASVEKMEKPEYLNGLWPQESDGNFSYGLGWDSVKTYPFTQYGIKALVKGGDTALYHGSLIVLPEKNMAMAVLSSGGASSYDEILAQEVLLQALKTKGDISEIKADKTFSHPVKVSMPESEKDFEGIYGSCSAAVKVTISDDGILTLSNLLVSGSAIENYTYTGDGKFLSYDGSNYCSFVQEKNGNTYLYSSGYSNLPSVGQTAGYGYSYQRLSANPISAQLKAVWDKRDGKRYYDVNEKYSSVVYASGTPCMQIQLLKDLEGYCACDQITDENNARAVLKIPGLYGRDLSDLTFFTVGKGQYLKSGNSVFISQDDIKLLSGKASFISCIGADGYAKWYKIGKKSANRKVKVTMPDQCSYSIYDENDSCVYNSVISKKASVTLPSGGYIVFVGAENTKFTVRYVK